MNVWKRGLEVGDDLVMDLLRKSPGEGERNFKRCCCIDQLGHILPFWIVIGCTFEV